MAFLDRVRHRRGAAYRKLHESQQIWRTALETSIWDLASGANTLRRMSVVNPEIHSVVGECALLRKGDSGFEEGVATLFGTGHPNVSRAVEDFLAKGPSSFDHHRLRIIAASAEAFTDKNHIAQMIRRLEITKLELAARPIDLAGAREQFKTSLPSTYRPETMRALVLDLVDSSTLQVLQNSPVDQVPEEGRAIVRKDLRKKLKGSDLEREAALASPFFDADAFTALLDVVEGKIERSERDPSGNRMNLGRWGLSKFFDVASDVSASDEQLLRALRLYQRCTPDDEVLRHAITDSRLLRLAGRSVLDAVDAYRASGNYEYSTRALLAQMASSSSLPEEIARDVIRAMGDAPMSVDGYTDTRLGVLRQLHYRRSDELMAPPTIDDIDRAVVELPVEQLTREMVTHVQSERALEVFIDRASEMPHQLLCEFIENPNLTLGQIERFVDALDPAHLSANDPMLRSVAQNLFVDQRRATDDHLARVLEKAMAVSPVGRNLSWLVRLAATNVFAGPRVLNVLAQYGAQLQSDEHEKLLRGIALSTPSTIVQAKLGNSAIATGDSRLASLLMRNSMLHADVWAVLSAQFPRPKMGLLRTSIEDWHDGFPEPWEERIDFFLSGEAPPGRAEEMLLIAASVPGVPGNFARRVLDSALISDDRLAALTADADMHVALSAATHHRATKMGAEGFVLPAEKQLQETAHAIVHGVVEMPRDRRLNSWSKLPNRDDEEFPRTQLHELIDGRVIDGLTITIPPTGRQLKKLSAEMHNCLSGYVDSVSAGDCVIVTTRTDDDLYAAAIEVKAPDPQSGQLGALVTLAEVNSKFNKNNVRPSFRNALSRMVEQINDGTLAPVQREPVVVEDEDPTSSLQRAPRRQRVPALRPQVDDSMDGGHYPADRGTAPDAPSLLASDRTAPDPEVPTAVNDLAGQVGIPDANPDRGLESL